VKVSGVHVYFICILPIACSLYLSNLFCQIRLKEATLHNGQSTKMFTKCLPGCYPRNVWSLVRGWVGFVTQTWQPCIGYSKKKKKTCASSAQKTKQKRITPLSI